MLFNNLNKKKNSKFKFILNIVNKIFKKTKINVKLSLVFFKNFINFLNLIFFKFRTVQHMFFNFDALFKSDEKLLKCHGRI
jgi:hypothetical protein